MTNDKVSVLYETVSKPHIHSASCIFFLIIWHNGCLVNKMIRMKMESLFLHSSWDNIALPFDCSCLHALQVSDQSQCIFISFRMYGTLPAEVCG